MVHCLQGWYYQRHHRTEGRLLERKTLKSGTPIVGERVPVKQPTSVVALGCNEVSQPPNRSCKLSLMHARENFQFLSFADTHFLSFVRRQWGGSGRGCKHTHVLEAIEGCLTHAFTRDDVKTTRWRASFPWRKFGAVVATLVYCSHVRQICSCVSVLRGEKCALLRRRTCVMLQRDSCHPIEHLNGFIMRQTV